MGQVKILKRGKEDLIEPGKKDETPRGSHNTQAVKSESLGFVSTDMLGPDVVLVPTQVRLTESMHIVNGFMPDRLLLHHATQFSSSAWLFHEEDR
ncbi:hypothetical protein NC653_035363 [Populus alba x Populus x berolinensis]|uniref:Uncharacterized protein n=1 Tax=Populus alba x Populus x berolinensis TaxID=444605 RepID=A0AAD6PX89_9ROSI|nr:hypothetical protein NC653_035363 [Populus alba x Populus x berolinensis]